MVLVYRNRDIKQWNQEKPEINSCICGQLIFDQGVKNTQWGKEYIINDTGAGHGDTHV